jgi:hypothetical protein
MTGFGVAGARVVAALVGFATLRTSAPAAAEIITAGGTAFAAFAVSEAPTLGTAGVGCV